MQIRSRSAGTPEKGTGAERTNLWSESAGRPWKTCARPHETLRESEEKYRSIFEDSFDGLFVTSSQGKILDINKKGALLFGYGSREEMQNLDLALDIYRNSADRQRMLAAGV